MWGGTERWREGREGRERGGRIAGYDASDASWLVQPAFVWEEGVACPLGSWLERTDQTAQLNQTHAASILSAPLVLFVPFRRDSRRLLC